MMNVAESLGFAGTGGVAVAYVPQIIHLYREHCSAGISLKAYLLWCVSSILFLIHAAMIHDTVFTLAQVVNLADIAVITILVKRYGRHVCLLHLRAQQSGK